MISKERIFEFISKQKTSFIASVDEEGFPNMKAMLAPRKIDGNRIYFTTNTSSLRVAQYRANPKASVYFYNKGRFRYEGVMLIGTMEVLEDAETRRKSGGRGTLCIIKRASPTPITAFCVLPRKRAGITAPSNRKASRSPEAYETVRKKKDCVRRRSLRKCYYSKHRKAENAI